MAEVQAAEIATRDNLLHWDGIFASREWGKYPPEELVRAVARNFYRAPDRAAVRMLEMGCGPGANVWYMLREGFSVTGIDGSPNAIDRLRKRVAAEGLEHELRPGGRLSLEVGDFATLPYRDDSFDLVVDVEAIGSNVTGVIRRALAEAHRVLKPSGLFFSKTFGLPTTGSGTGRQLEAGTSANPETGSVAGAGVVHFFAEDELRELLSAFADCSIGWVHRRDGDTGFDIHEWVVLARK